MEALSQHIEFVLELDKLKAVKRKTLVQSDQNRSENSAEHSWHIALMAHSLVEYASPPVDINRVIMMLLLHDVVEIDAGDMFAFADEAAHEAQAEKEFAAAKRIFGLLPPKQSLAYQTLWFEFEEAQSPDAQFAKAMDRMLPVFQNMHNAGGSWAKHQVTASQALKRNAFLQISAPRLWDYVKVQISLAIEQGWLIDA